MFLMGFDSGFRHQIRKDLQASASLFYFRAVSIMFGVSNTLTWRIVFTGITLNSRRYAQEQGGCLYFWHRFFVRCDSRTLTTNKQTNAPANTGAFVYLLVITVI